MKLTRRVTRTLTTGRVLSMADIKITPITTISNFKLTMDMTNIEASDLQGAIQILINEHGSQVNEHGSQVPRTHIVWQLFDAIEAFMKGGN